MKRNSLLTKLVLGTVILMFTGFIAACDDGDVIGDSASVGVLAASPNVANECTGICDGNVPSSYSSIPTNAQGGGHRYTQHRLPGYTPAATVYMPTDVQKAGAIVFCPPMTGVQAMFAAWGPFFAGNGIILVTMDTSTPMDPVDMRDDQQWRAVNALKNDPQVRNILDPSRVGVMGWSMGGGATWINAQTREVKTAMSVAGHNLTAGATSKGRGIKCPTALFNGATDMTILGGLGQSDGVYNAIPAGIPKLIYVVTGVGHFTWGGPTTSGPDVARLALAFQKTFLHDDGRWGKFLKRPSARVAKFQTNITANY